MKKITAPILGIVLMASVVCGCATKPTDPEELAIYNQTNDPMEPMNRGTHAFNQWFDEWVFVPVAKGYRWLFPQFMRTGLYNFSFWLKQPVYFVNATLQGEGKQMAQISGRFLVNTFWGGLGFVDVATDLGIPSPNLDFGQTLGVWGVDRGPYLVLPLLGPSDIRDAVGYGVDLTANPINIATNEIWWGLIYSRAAVEGIDQRERAIAFLDSLKNSSTDYYATLRSMYLQNREQKVNKNKQNDVGEAIEPKSYEFDFPDFEDDF